LIVLKCQLVILSSRFEDKRDKCSKTVLFLVGFAVIIFDTDDSSNAVPNL